MLRHLSIRHFAIIDTLDLAFDSGFNVLTGETGAGKSILVGALHLVLGGRASSDLVRTGCKYAEVVALFDNPTDAETCDKLNEAGLHLLDETLICRRQVLKEGRSRAWINDQVVSIGLLADISRRLVDISGQHQHQSLLRPENHLLLLDQAAGLVENRQAFALHYEELAVLHRKRSQLLKSEREKREREDFLRFQLDEVVVAHVLPKEDQSLAKERKILRHAEKIREGMDTASTMLSGDSGALAKLAKTEQALLKIASYLPDASSIASRLQSIQYDLDDIAESLQKTEQAIHAEPGRLDEVEERFSLLQRLLKKHGPLVSDLFSKQESMVKELAQLEDMEQAKADLDQQIKACARLVLQAALVLSKKRKDGARLFDRAVEKQLSDLGMRKTRFQISVKNRNETDEAGINLDSFSVSSTGMDHVEFMLSPNVGEALKALTKIVSGGELSRLMLAIKGVLLNRDPVSVTVFDEVDSGISGAVADVVGRKIYGLSKARQVICITHLPQIAAFGEHHFHVKKENREGRTFSSVMPLSSEDERVNELARLLSGKDVTNTTRAAALELIQQAKFS